MSAIAHELWAAAQLAPGEGIQDGVARLESILASHPEQDDGLTVAYMLGRHDGRKDKGAEQPRGETTHQHFYDDGYCDICGVCEQDAQQKAATDAQAVAYVHPDELAALVRDAKKFGKTQYCIDAFAKPVGLNTIPLYDHPAPSQAVGAVGDGVGMRLEVALDFADNPRPYHTLQAPADTNGELYRALAVLAAAYREAVNAHPAVATAAEAEGICLEPDGCPTELAVLQRFWREHQNKFNSFDEALASTLDYRNSPKYDGPIGSVRKDNDTE